MSVTKIAPPRDKTLPANDEPARAGMGHNRPPLDVEAVIDMKERLDERRFGPNQDMTFAQWVDALLGSAGRASAVDDETAARCGELEKKIGAAIKHVEGAHVDAKAPYLEAGRAVDALKNQLVGPLSDAKRAVNNKSTQFLREENQRREAEARRQREEAMRLQREEQERIDAARAAQGEQEPERDAFGLLPPSEPPISAVAPVAAPEPMQFRSDEGSLLSGTKVWVGTVTDYELAFMAVAKNSKVQEAIDKAIAALVKGGLHEIPGVSIVQDIKARAR